MSQIGFRKVDLHIHTPGSYCYSEEATTCRHIVDAAVACDLDAIAVTDHNTAANIEEIRRIAAEDMKLVVFPAMELTTRSGHFLALFDIDVKTVVLENLLEELGVNRSKRGDGAEVIPLETPLIFTKVVAYGGIVIAAHIERWPSGFLENKDSRAMKIAIHNNPHLSGLEITIPQNREKWEKGLMRSYTRPMACLQGSDAHSPEDVGRRPSYLRLKEINLDSLKAVLNDWQNNIGFSREELGDEIQ